MRSFLGDAFPMVPYQLFAWFDSGFLFVSVYGTHFLCEGAFCAFVPGSWNLWWSSFRLTCWMWPGGEVMAFCRSFTSMNPSVRHREL